MRLATLALLALAAPAALAQPQTPLYPGSSGQPLLDALAADYAPAQALGYGPARDSLYAYEQRTDGALCGAYTRFCIQLTPGVDPSTDAFHQGVNAEHTWPQSQGAADEPSKSDLHHLFPAKANVNSSRSNHPYGEIPDAAADGWYREASSQSTPPSVFVDEWSEKDNDHPDPAWGGRFEPRHDHKGNAARAVFYFRAIHAGQVAAYGSEAFFDVQAPDLIRWHYDDPVDLEEYARSEWIAGLQGTPNPFVLDSTLARRAFGLSGGAGDGGSGGADPAGPLWVNEIHYDNASTDVDEGVEVAGPAGASLAGWTVVLYNGSGGGAYRTVALSGALDNQQGGFGTVWVPIAGMQNGTPDGLALVAPDGTVVQFLSYEGTLTASDGAASGTTSTDIGVAETASTPVGQSLQLVGVGEGAEDFAWQAPTAATPGTPNDGQTLGDGSVPTPPVALWINELHYDNEGADRDEGVEVAGTAGTDLTGWSVAFYNGSTGAVYATEPLTGQVDDEGDGLGAVWFDVDGLQNGSPDGLALVDPDGGVAEFLSYEGTVTATSGPAAGLTATDLGVAESSATPKGRSLQRTGSGQAVGDFAWSSPQRHTRGKVNRGQSFEDAVRAAVANAPAPTGAAFELVVFPNPTRGAAGASLRLTTPGAVRAEVYDVLGRRLGHVDAGLLAAGLHTLALPLDGLSAGTYAVRVTVGEEAAVRAITVAP